MSKKRSVPEPSPEPESSRVDDQIGGLLRRAHQRYSALFNTSIHTLTPSQYLVLAKLAEIGEVSQNALGQQVAMDAATIKGVVDRLSARRLVVGRRDTEDRRLLLVSMTEQGKEAYAKTFLAASDVERQTVQPLSGRELSLLKKLLVRIC